MPSETAGVSVKDVLFQRRPDLGDLLLGCDNTNTAMPYVDIVNELLEALVAPTDAAVVFQTTLPAAELRAHPEHVRTAAVRHAAHRRLPDGARRSTCGRPRRARSSTTSASPAASG